MANIRDVAAAANVSISTVSSVLSGQKYVSPRLEARVKSAAGRLGYRTGARASASADENATQAQGSECAKAAAARKQPGDRREIGVILPGIYSSFFPPLLNGITEAAAEFGYTVQLSDSGRLFKKERELVYALIDRGIDSIVLDSVCALEDEQAYFGELLGALEARGGHLVVMSREFTNDRLNQVYVDNYAAAYEATEHLISLGHKRIAHICGSNVFRHSSERLKGYRTALLDHGLPADEHLTLEGDFSPLSGYAAMDDFLAKGMTASAVFSANDQMAIGAIKAIRKHGLTIPGDMAVAGFDNLFMSSLIDPGLTTVQYPIYQMGYRAVRVLAERHAGLTPPIRTRLSARLIVRRSTDPSQIDDWDLQKW